VTARFDIAAILAFVSLLFVIVAVLRFQRRACFGPNSTHAVTRAGRLPGGRHPEFGGDGTEAESERDGSSEQSAGRSG
jgi:hypothetical protein